MQKRNILKFEGNGIFLYFIIDMVCATSSVFLFNVNEYIPMICCLGICVISLLLALQIEDVPLDNKQGNIALDFKEIFKSSFVWSLFAYSFIMCGVLSFAIIIPIFIIQNSSKQPLYYKKI